MITENRFNLIDEPWIPVVDVGRVSLKQLFTDNSYKALGGNPVQKIALTKLLLAIAQSAYTPKDNDDWAELGVAGMATKCLAYLEKWHDSFWLYGEKPFLQMPAIASAAIQPFGAVLPEVSTGNTTVLTQSHMERSLSDADKAILIITLMGFALGGKKTDNSVVLTKGYKGKTNDKGKPATSKPGTSVGHMGFMHNFLLAENLQETLWLNLLTQEQISSQKMFTQGLGVAPWEKMPVGEECDVAKILQQSLIGRLIPVTRFCQLVEQGLHYSEGIAHLGYKDGMVDPSVAVNYSGKDLKALWVDTEKRPWRQLTSLLCFIKQSESSGFDSLQIRCGVLRAREQIQCFGVWSGGLRVSSNAGEQYVSGTDDFVESSIFLESNWLGEWWYTHLKAEMNELETVAKNVYGTTMAYCKEQKMEGDSQAAQASNLFWQLCERQFQNLVNACADGEDNEQLRKKLRITFAGFANKAYNTFCPKDTARQLDAWAKCQPNLSKYLTV